MSNLLEKASIITTPTAYSSGFIHSVKPEQSLGSELITNGDFDTDSDWSKASGTTISDGKLNITAISTNDRTFQNAGLVQGKNYKVDFEVSNYNSGSLNVLMGGSTTPNISNITANGIYSFYQKSLGANSFFYFKGNLLNASITNVSVREEIDADFTFTRNTEATRVNSQGLVESVQILGSNVVTNGDFSQIGNELITNGDFATNTDWILNNWTIADGKASLVNGSSFIVQNAVLEAGKTYKIQYEILEYSSGTIRWRTNQVNGSNNGSVKLVTDFITPAGTSFAIQGYNSFTGSISNISAVEIIDWIAGDGWSFGGNKASCDGTQTDVTGLIQTISTNIQNQLVKISFTLDISAGTLSGSLNNSGDTEFDALTTSGNYSVEATSTDANPTILFLGDANFVGSISNVVIEPATDDTDLPRIDYTGGGCGSWLLEPQRINLITRSNEFSFWNPLGNRISRTRNSITSPDGTVNGNVITQLAATGGIRLRFSGILTAGNEYTFSIYAKKGNHDRMIMNISGTNTTFTLTDEWVRYEITETATATFVDVGIVEGVVGDFIYIYGAQVEEASNSTSYIPTIGSTRTRNKDLAINAGSSDLINSTEGVLYAELKSISELVDSPMTISINNNNNTNRLLIFKVVGNNKLLFQIKNPSDTVEFTSATTNTTFDKVAIKYKSSDYAVWINGVEVFTDTTTSSVPTGLSRLDFSEFDGSSVFQGNARCVAVFKEALTDAELTALTTI